MALDRKWRVSHSIATTEGILGGQYTITQITEQ